MVSPTSMALRAGNWRLCHDLSWPKPDAAPPFESSNAADKPFIKHLRMAHLSQLAQAAATMLAADLPVLVAKFDLSKAYKRTGINRASRPRRSFWTQHGAQTLDRVCFGQGDGPGYFSSQ